MCALSVVHQHHPQCCVFKEIRFWLYPGLYEILNSKLSNTSFRLLQSMASPGRMISSATPSSSLASSRRRSRPTPARRVRRVPWRRLCASRQNRSRLNGKRPSTSNAAPFESIRHFWLMRTALQWPIPLPAKWSFWTIWSRWQPTVSRYGHP